MTKLSNMIGLDAARLLPPRRLAIGLAILCLTPVLVLVDWASSLSAATV